NFQSGIGQTGSRSAVESSVKFLPYFFFKSVFMKCPVCHHRQAAGTQKRASCELCSSTKSSVIARGFMAVLALCVIASVVL
ncbi:MAG TPA: hypothetical protein VF663_12235, partial [Telluria sp.]